MSSPQTIQPSTADNYIYKNAATTNYGTQTYMELYNAAATLRYGLCSFDFHTVVPAGATITVATLSLYLYATGGVRTIGVYRLLRADWNETQSTWNIFKTNNNWTTAGALSDGNDFTSTDAATSASPATNHWQTWDVKKQIQTARDSVSGVAHFLLKDTAEPGAQAQYYYSREYTTDSAKCPKLYIEYTMPSGASFLLRMI
jgi:hypothetical protein